MFHHQDPQDQDHDQPNFLLCSDQDLSKYIKQLPRYRIDVISREELKQSISQPKPDRIHSIFRKTKKKLKTHYNEGRWSQKEEDLYLKFTRQAKSAQTWGEKHTYKKRLNYFKEMSKFIQTRSPLQCRSHDQKVVLKKVQKAHSDSSSPSSNDSLEELELASDEDTPSQAKIEVKVESDSYHTGETRHEISPKSPQIPSLSFDYPGLTKPDPCFNLVCGESLPLPVTKPIFANPSSFKMSFPGFNKENELEKRSMQLEEEGASGKDLERFKEDYFGMMRRMMRRRMLDVLSSCPMLEE